MTLAGNYAASRSAHSEAIAHFTKALELVEGYADNSRGLAQQLPVLIGLGASLMTTKGYAAAEVEHVYERAHTICRQINASRADLFRVLFGLWQYYVIRPNLSASTEVARELLRLAEAGGERLNLLVAHRCVAQSLWNSQSSSNVSRPTTRRSLCTVPKTIIHTDSSTVRTLAFPAFPFR